MKPPQMTSGKVLQALATRHEKDVFVSECKDGSTLIGKHARLDAWAMTRSWRHLTCTGYEIKVSRSDYGQDDKWHWYLPMCHQLYFACPWKLIQVEEVPGDVGLLWVASGGRVKIAKKATHREIELPVGTLCYLLMWRARFDQPRAASRADYYQRLVEQAQKDQELGREVGHLLREQTRKVLEENRCLKRRIEVLEAVQAEAQALGLSLSGWQVRQEILLKLREVLTGVPDGFRRALGDTRRICDDLLCRLDNLEHTARQQERHGQEPPPPPLTEMVGMVSQE